MQALNFWALAVGGAAIALPLFIHLLTRARGAPLVYPTYRFVFEALTARRRVSRLRDWLVLILRTLALAALAALFARFLLSAPPSAESPSSGKWAVIVLDVSQSMGSQGSGAAPIGLAQHAAQKLLQDGSIRRADLILAGQTSHAVFGKLSQNLFAMREEIARATVRPEMLDPTAAFAAAAGALKSLAPEEHQAGEVVVLTDLQRSNWATASFSALPAGVPVRVVNVRPASEAPVNTAILRAWSSGLACVGRPTTLVVELAHYGSSPITRTLELEFEKQILRKKITLPPHQRRQESFVVVPAAAAPQIVRFRLTGERDAMALDDARALALIVRQGRRIALVTGEPENRIGSASYFVDRALRASAESGFEISRLPPDRLLETEPSLARIDLLVLVEPGRLSSEGIQACSRLLSRGVPVFYALQSPADADSLAEWVSHLGPAAQMPVSFVPMERHAPPRFMVWADTSQRPFRIFGPGLERFTRELVLHGGLRSASRGSVEEEGRVLAKLSDGSAALVLVPVHAGRMALLNLPIRDHLGKSALMVPLIQEIAVDLIEGPERAGARSATAGRALSLPLPGGGTQNFSWSVLDEEGKTVVGPRVLEDTGGSFLIWSPADRIGAFLVKRAGGEIDEAFTVGLAPDESDLHAIDPRVLEERIARGRSVAVQGSSEALAEHGRTKETWPWFAAAAMACLLVEMAVLKIFRT